MGNQCTKLEVFNFSRFRDIVEGGTKILNCSRNVTTSFLWTFYRPLAEI